MKLSRLASAARGARALAKRRRLDFIGWTPPQAAFLRDPSKTKLLRTGNQLGKTTAGLSEMIYRCRGDHPFLDVPPPPITAWALAASWPQSLSLQHKLNELLDPDELDPRTRTFDPKHGFGANGPVVLFKNGSIIRIRTTQQAGLDLSGATIHFALFDEPPWSQRVFSEVDKRRLRTNGTLAVTLTPINRPCGFLREMAEAGGLSDHHYRLEPENLIPEGHTEPLTLTDGTPMDAAWIESVLASTLPHELPVVCHGEWEVRTMSRYFAAFSDVEHVSDELPRGRCEVVLGIDHGDGANFSQCAILAAVSSLTGAIWVLDEYVSTESTTTRQDAEAILEMLARNGLTWRDLDQAHGDRSWTGRKSTHARKSNALLTDALSDLLGSEPAPRIRTVKRGHGRGRGSVAHGGRFLHAAMVRDQFYVHPRCERLIQCLNKWSFQDDEWKHGIDGLRYALDRHIFAPHRSVSGPPVYLYG